MRRFIILGIAGLVALCSCSLKEDRSDCPCYLEVDVSGVKSDVVKLSAWSGLEIFSESIPKAGLKAFHEYLVPRGQLRLTAVGNTYNLIQEGSQLIVEIGHQMDSLFAYTAQVDTRGELARDVVRMDKQFATVSLEFKDTDDGRAGYNLLVTGAIGGVDAKTLEPITGPFRCVPELAPDRGFVFRVPRQVDDTLQADIYSDTGIVETIPVGELIQKAAFDWSKSSLGDVHILADLPAHTFTITVMEWEGPVTFNITI